LQQQTKALSDAAKDSARAPRECRDVLPALPLPPVSEINRRPRSLFDAEFAGTQGGRFRPRAAR